MGVSSPISRGRITLPVEKGMPMEMGYMIGRWGCDAVRDGDGTELPPQVRPPGLERHLEAPGFHYPKNLRLRPACFDDFTLDFFCQAKSVGVIVG
jgi:hypothetical protein